MMCLTIQRSYSGILREITIMGNFLKKDNKKNHHTRHNVAKCVVVFIDAYSDFLPDVLTEDETEA